MLIFLIQFYSLERKHVFSCIKAMSKKKKKMRYALTQNLNITTLIKNPRIPNKYELTIEKIKNLKIGDTSKIREPLFLRNSIVNAWCISYGTGKDSGNMFSPNYFWIGFYDDGSFKFNFTCYGDMCTYEFKEFYKIEEIEILDDFLIQEKFLEKINHLIDEGILIF